MAAFYHTVHLIKSYSPTESVGCWFDIISALPVEISSSIFRMLDPISMFAAMRVSRRWHRLYRADHPLRRALKKKVLEQHRKNMEFIHNLSVRPTDSYYRRNFSVPSLRLGTPDKASKKRKRTCTKHHVQRAKHLRI